MDEEDPHYNEDEDSDFAPGWLVGRPDQINSIDGLWRAMKRVSDHAH